MRLTACLLVAVAVSGATKALAQTGANVTIQLPNVSTFGVNTTVLVPDSGPSPFARQRQARYSRAMYGVLPRQGAIGLNSTASAASITAQIHDQRATDEAILRAARARRTHWVRGSSPSRFESALAPTGPRLQSVAEIERKRAQQQADAQEESLQLVERARGAHLAGKSGVAAIYYGMAARRATGELKRAIETEASRLTRPTDAPSAKPIARTP